MGNNYGSKVDEPALGQWVRVLRKGRQNRKDMLNNAILSEATKKSPFSLGQIFGAASLTVANVASQKPESLCPGFRNPLFQEDCRQDPVSPASMERMLRVKTRTEEEAKFAGAAATAGATARTIGLLEVHESDLSKSAKFAGLAATASATAGTILLSFPRLPGLPVRQQRQVRVQESLDCVR